MIKLNEDERNSTYNKNKNDELNNIVSVFNRIYQFFEHNIFFGWTTNESKLLKWVKVSKKKIDMIKDKVKFKMQKIIIGKLDQIVKSLLLLSNLINYFKI